MRHDQLKHVLATTATSLPVVLDGSGDGPAAAGGPVLGISV